MHSEYTEVLDRKCAVEAWACRRKWAPFLGQTSRLGLGLCVVFELTEDFFRSSEVNRKESTWPRQG